MANLADEIQKEIIFAEKHVEWLKNNSPHTDIEDLTNMLDDFNNSFPLMKQASKMANITKADLTKILEQPNAYNLLEENKEQIPKIIRGMVAKFLTKPNVQALQELYTQQGGLKRRVESTMIKSLGMQKKDYYEKNEGIDKQFKDDKVKTFSKHVDDYLKDLEGPKLQK